LDWIGLEWVKTVRLKDKEREESAEEERRGGEGRGEGRKG